MLLWLAHWTRNFLLDAWGDCLWQRSAFPFYDFGLPRTGSSSAVYPGSLDSLCSSSGISSYSAWALGLIWNGLGFAKSFSPTDIYMLGPIAPQFFFFFFLRILSILTHIHGERGESLKKTDSGIYLKEPNS